MYTLSKHASIKRATPIMSSCHMKSGVKSGLQHGDAECHLINGPALGPGHIKN